MVVDWKKALLTSGKSNTKVAKNKMDTYYLSLQPTDLNSKKENLCRFSTKECRDQCLQYAGRQGFSNVVKSRERKTELFVNYRRQFLEKLWGELEILNKKEKCAVRLNLLSDVNWVNEFKGVGKDMSSLDKVQFYDYTKDHLKLGNIIHNYHLTLSYSGHNWTQCEEVLKRGINVAVVFKKEVPLQYKGFPVLNGDVSDERFLDPKGHIVGLKYKVPHGKKYITNKFVVDEI
jgi:hypothetical protein